MLDKVTGSRNWLEHAVKLVTKAVKSQDMFNDIQNILYISKIQNKHGRLRTLQFNKK